MDTVSKRNAVQITETDGPKYDPTKHHKANFPMGEVAHHWARNSLPRGRASNLYFEDGIIYSFGRHYPIARHVTVRKTKLKCVLFTTDEAKGYGRVWNRVSPTTSRHKRDVQSAIPKDLPTFHVPNVKADSRQHHLENLKWFEEQAKVHYNKAQKATRNKPWLLGKAIEFLEDGGRYADFMGLQKAPRTPTGDDLAAFRTKCDKAVEAARVRQEALDATAPERIAKRNAAKLAAYERAVARWEAKLKEWHECLLDALPEKPTMPTCLWRSGGRRPIWFWRRDQETYVRVSRDKFLQTSKGMVVPLDQVLPVLETIRSHSMDANGVVEDRFFKISVFKISVRGSEWDGHIDWVKKLFTIGCHRVSFEEIERAAQAAGL